MREAVIVSSVRTAVGKAYKGTLRNAFPESLPQDPCELTADCQQLTVNCQLTTQLCGTGSGLLPENWSS